MIRVGPRPGVHLIDGTMDAHDLDLLTRWIEQNQEVILRYWNEEIDTVEAIQNLKRLESAPQLQTGDRSASSRVYPCCSAANPPLAGADLTR